jgi:hypothetical protein
MNTLTATNILIALIAGLLIALAASPATQSAPKSYDAVQLIEYQTCLDYFLEDVEEESATRELLSLGLRICKDLRPR